MIGKEDFVTFEVAKMLHEKGYSGTVTAVTLYEAQKWLRVNHNIFVVVFPHYSRKYETIEYEYMIATFFDLLDKPYRHKWEKSKEYYEKYQECLNSGIDEALKLI